MRQRWWWRSPQTSHGKAPSSSLVASTGTSPLGDVCRTRRTRRAIGTAEVGHVAGAGAVAPDPLLLACAGHEAAAGDPAAGVVAAHDETDAARIEDGDQPGCRVAAVEHQHVVGAQALQCLEQHLALADLRAVHAGVQGQLRPGQMPREQALIAARGSAAQGMTAAHGGREKRRVGDHRPQAAPQRGHRRRALDEPVVEAAERIVAQAVACTGEGAIRGHALGRGLIMKVGEEVVQTGLLRLVARARQRRDQGRQPPLAPPGERALGIVSSRGRGKLSRVDGVAQAPKDMLDILTVLRPTRS